MRTWVWIRQTHMNGTALGRQEDPWTSQPASLANWPTPGQVRESVSKSKVEKDTQC